MSGDRPTISARDLVAVLKALPPDKSVLIIGPHGTGKSQIVAALALHLGVPLIDRRLAQMTEGDMIGLPNVSDDVTRFLPVDWFAAAAQEPAVLLLDELNRATPEIMQAAFQVVLDRELNGLQLHPETRVIACVNAGASYSVNEMDPALLNRFAIFNLESSAEDWIAWARVNNVDPVIVDFIRDNPGELREKDISKISPMSASPTPRGWEAVDKCLKYAGMAPETFAGKDPPALFYPMIVSMLGAPTSIAFAKYVQLYQRVITAEDILDNFEDRKEDLFNMTHDAVVALLDKIGDHCSKNNWTSDQVSNLYRWAEKMFNGEDVLKLFAAVAGTKNMNNIQVFHQSQFTPMILEVTKKAKELQDKV